MAVKQTITVLPSSPAPSPLSSNNPNKRWPPMANRTSLPYKLTTLSKQKLAREATAPDPDIRRCLCHFRLHVRSVEWTQNEMTAKINSFELESESESEDEDTTAHQRRALPQPQDEKESSPSPSSPTDDDAVRTQPQPEPEHRPLPLPATAANNEAEQDPHNEIMADKTKDSEQTMIQVHFDVTAPSSSPDSKDKDKEGLLEKGRNCLEKTVQRKSFWPSPGQCIPVRIAG